LESPSILGSDWLQNQGRLYPESAALIKKGMAKLSRRRAWMGAYLNTAATHSAIASAPNSLGGRVITLDFMSEMTVRHERATAYLGHDRAACKKRVV
jgi:hypothetical protein